MYKSAVGMKILHIITSLSNGGRERRMAQLVNGLASHDINQAIILTGPYATTIDYYVDGSVKIYDYSTENSKRELLCKIYKCISEEKPDILHVWTELRYILLLSIYARLTHNIKLVTGFLADGNSVKKKLTRAVFQITFKASDAIVSNSKAGIVAKEAPEKKSAVIYNGFDFKRLSEKPFDSEKLKKDIKCDGKTVVTMCARLAPPKNWEMFLNVAEWFGKQGDHNIQFVAVGGGEHFEKISSQIKSRHISNISLLGQRNDVENILQITDISLLFSNSHIHAEGVSNAIMESMAAGCPVIATDGGGTPEIITSGHDGYIIPPNDTEAAIDKIIYLISNPQKLTQMKGNAVHTILERFTLEGMTKHYIELYNKIIN